jgi:hypothetical protein
MMYALFLLKALGQGEISDYLEKRYADHCAGSAGRTTSLDSPVSRILSEGRKKRGTLVKY